MTARATASHPVGVSAAATSVTGRGPGRSPRGTTALLTSALLVASAPAGAEQRRPEKRPESGPAAGNVTGAATAEILFEEGRSLMARGQYPAACDKFEASHRIEPSVGALLNLGECRERNGQVSSAWLVFRQAAALAGRHGDARREALARKRADALARKLAYLVITVPAPDRVPDLVLTRNGEPIAPELWGQRIPVDPGRHEVRASAPGRTAFVTEVAPTVGQVVELAVPVLGEERAPAAAAPDAPDSAPATSDAAVASTPSGPAPADTGAGAARSRRRLAIAALAAGAAGVGVGAVFALRSRGKWDEADPHCDEENRCDQTGYDLAQSARSAGVVSYLGYGLGAASLAAGAVLWWLAPGAPTKVGAPQARIRVRPLLGGTQRGVWLDWQF
jgi:hypothetical protein